MYDSRPLPAQYTTFPRIMIQEPKAHVNSAAPGVGGRIIVHDAFTPEPNSPIPHPQKTYPRPPAHPLGSTRPHQEGTSSGGVHGRGRMQSRRCGAAGGNVCRHAGRGADAPLSPPAHAAGTWRFNSAPRDSETIAHPRRRSCAETCVDGRLRAYALK